MAVIASRRPLQHIVKITSKKRCPEIITFKHGHVNENGKYTIVASDKLYMEEAGDATKAIKQRIEDIWKAMATD